MIHTDTLTGVHIKGYEVIEELAHGNYGIVYRGIQKRLNRCVAIKILEESLSRDLCYVKNFHHEAEVAALLTHPNVVQAYDVGQAETGEFFFAMELVDGEDISRKMKRDGKIKWRQALHWMSFVADALCYGVHKNRVTHGDIKPANVLITKNGQVKLADLGLACMGGEEKSKDVMLTPYYAAPEVIDGSWK
ncbi:MAG: serine/threonine protein kinase, partial [Lentisphaeraceae bacterium]|nr:serine/threonine protein kinase [Lentisphaeraceae bacterium]